MYDRDNHRYGMQLPGGYSLIYRKEILIRLMELELEVLEERNGKYLISDEELSYIQQIWIEDGDVDMSVARICKHRDVKIDPHYEKAVKAASIMQMKTFYGETVDKSLYNGVWYIVNGLNKNACARYYTLMALQIEKAGHDSQIVLDALRHGKSEDIKPVIKYIKTLPVETKMDFLSTYEERYIRAEWKRDELSFVKFMDFYTQGRIKKPQRKLFGYEGDYGKHFEALEMLETGVDIIDIDNELISLQDKMKWFDNWNSND